MRQETKSFIYFIEPYINLITIYIFEKCSLHIFYIS